jgi:hypothetical protein
MTEIEVGHCRVQLRHAGVDQHARIGMADDVHVDRVRSPSARSNAPDRDGMVCRLETADPNNIPFDQGPGFDVGCPVRSSPPPTGVTAESRRSTSSTGAADSRHVVPEPLLGCRDRPPAAIDTQRERVGDDQDASGPCEGDPDVGAGGALGQQ